MKPHTALSALLVALGNVQMIGDLTGNRIIKGVGAALHASPAAKVFTAQDGLETFSAQFYVEWQAPDGGLRSVQLTPSLYSHVRGPYNRRNIYGAAIAGGPFLARQDWGAPNARERQPVRVLRTGCAAQRIGAAKRAGRGATYRARRAS